MSKCLNEPAWAARLLRVGKRVPFTLAMVVAMLAVAIFQGTLAENTAPAVILYWGFGLHNLWDGRLYTLVVSTFLVHEPWELLGGILLLIGTLGVYEWIVGTRRSFVLYWSANLVAPVLSALLFLWPHYLAGTSFGLQLAALSDVGPSAGALGCLGAWVARLPGRYRTGALILILAALIGKMALFLDLDSDATHLVGFAVGLGLDRLLWARVTRRAASQHTGG